MQDGRGILQSSSHNCLVCVYFCLPHPVAVSAFMIGSGLCACTEMLCREASEIFKLSGC